MSIDQARQRQHPTMVLISPPFFHVKFVLKWGLGLYTGARSDMIIAETMISDYSLYNKLIFMIAYWFKNLSEKLIFVVFKLLYLCWWMIDIFLALLDWQITQLYVQSDIQILGWAYNHVQPILKFAQNLGVGLHSKVGLYSRQYGNRIPISVVCFIW